MMADNDNRQQQMWELVYELLGDEEAEALRARITSEPDAARLYAEVKQQAELVAAAAKLQEPPITLQRPTSEQAGDSKVVAKRKRRQRPAKSPSGGIRGVNWLVSLAAIVLVGYVGYVYLKPDSPVNRRQAERARQDIAREHVRTVITGPAKLQPGVEGYFHVSTTSLGGQPRSGRIAYRLYDSQGELRLDRTGRTDASGNLRIELPALLVADNARLEVETSQGLKTHTVKTHLQLDQVRLATQLSLDKPLYRPGETVFYRSLTLSRFGLRDDRELVVQFELLNPAGTVIDESKHAGFTHRGVGNGVFTIPPHFPGGAYALVARSPYGEFPEARREFFVRRYRTPRLKKELELTRDSYTPGDKVVADLSVERAEGGPAADAQLRISVTVDGLPVEVPQAEAAVAADGTYQVKFRLPETIDKGAGTLSVVVDDGGTRETIVKTIPINLGKVDVRFYPEGGELVACLENRVYFHALDPLGKPVHIEGAIVDADGNELARVETTHEGRGALRFTPAAGQKYYLRITKPQGAGQQSQLPAVGDEAFLVIDGGSGVFDAGQPIEIDLRWNESRALVLVAACRGAQVGQQQIFAEGTGISAAGSRRVTLPLAPQAEGVIRLTVYDYSADPPRPIAERLVYRRPARKLNIALADQSEAYAPGDKVKLSLLVTDENGSPTPAALGVAVVDDALLSLADDKTPSMTTHFRLTTEVARPEDLEDADFYLSDDLDAPQALDLLLGTQGWRRFVQLSGAQLVRGDAAADTEAEVEIDQALERLVAMDATAEPPVVYDNLALVQRDCDDALAAYDGARQADLHQAGEICLLGGVVLLVVLTLSGLMRLVSGVKIWLPALTAATACLALGAYWTAQRVDQQGQLALDSYFSFGFGPEVALRSATEEADEETLNFGRNGRGFDDDDLLARGLEGRADDLTALGLDLKGEKNDLYFWGMLGGVRDLDEEEYEREELARDRLGRDLQRLGEMLAELEGDDGAVPRFDRAGVAFGNFADDFEIEQGWYAGGKLLNDRRARKRQLGAYYEEALQQAVQAGDINAVIDLAKSIEAKYKQYRFTVRQYAHQHRVSQPGVRTDFAETIYWNPLLLVDASGRASIEFDLSDSVTKFRLSADGHHAGRIGTGGGEIASRIPFSLEPKLPLQVNAGDRIELPLAVNNDTDGPLSVTVEFLHSDLLSLVDSPQRTLDLGQGQRSREYFSLDVIGHTGQATLEFKAQAGNLADGVQRSIQVVPPGFPIAQSYAGQIDGEVELNVRLPEFWVPGSLEVSLQAFPSSLADLQKGVEDILREPSGCFEQSSSSNYPNVLALQYMQEHDVANPAFTRHAKELLKSGYGKLVGFECPQKGYEWFGGDPGHEALTAYGLMEFRDMSQVWQVDQQMVQRTAAWLLSRRDGKGGFTRNPRALDSFGGAGQDITDAYIVWALSEGGQQGIETELAHVVGLAQTSDDPYLIALAAASALNAELPEGQQLLERLAQHQHQDGRLEAANGTITRSGGLSMQIETTALAAMAWLKSPKTAAHANKAVEWITANRQGRGGFGSTQATIMALKSLIDHSKANRRTINDGALVLMSDGSEVARSPFHAGHQQAISLEGITGLLHAGDNELTISLTGDNQMPYVLDVSYRTLKPAADDNCPVRLTTRLAKENLIAGDTVGLSVELANVSDQGQPMTIAIVGLPAGLEARQDQLEELKKAGKFDYYEIDARELIFYWRSLGPDVKDDRSIAFDLDLIAEIPGRYTGPASRAYLYYTAEQKHWVEPLTVKIERE